MNVFIVIGGWDYEGHEGEGVEVFNCREDAENFAANNKSRYHYIDIFERKVDVPEMVAEDENDRDKGWGN